MIILIRSNDANPDPRLQKYINYLEKTQQSYKVIAWNRGEDILEKENYIYFNYPAAFGLGMKNIPKKIMWFQFIRRQLWKNRKQYQTIHACDLDTAIPAFFMKSVLKKSMIFDVFDWVSSENSKGFLGKVILTIENRIFKKCDFTIICEEYRINQVREDSRRRSAVLPNIPDIHLQRDGIVEKKIAVQRQHFEKIISYVGVFDSNRGIEHLLQVVAESPDICLNIAGFGLLESEVKCYAERYENIVYWGKVDYNIGLNIMSYSDMIVAFYYLSNPVHSFAAPNKYYEGLFLGKALLTNEGTLLAEKVTAANTGYVIAEGAASLEHFLNLPLETQHIELKNINSKKLWDDVYQSYTANFMENEYQKMLN
ncbi:hypothetical protein I6G82_15335 [Lysinibacillus macroides]|uniref:Glycosyl transferase family 1 domain-containing protein n=1 Tax=Lysinibacillus macroides TaxID=33935 RepID=A0A0N0CX00_9BACI|nr:hypothetical protein [Lysinibacillus macroides]KOY83881.1 hypothetical protein ADM90_00255 [Lysinibacillus macroides]QPR66648.1 hypothetical protein I6G82_15335 [Lysinibacillus macroides]